MYQGQTARARGTVGSMEVVEVSRGPVHRYAGLGNVLFTLYWGSPEASVLDDRVAWWEQMARTHGGGGLFVVVAADASGHLPDADFRAKSRAQAQRFSESLLFSGCLIEGDGLSQSLLRTFLRGLSVAVPQRVETAFFAQVPEATEWVAERARPYGGPEPEALARALESLRDR